jgi:hypothetical protein
LEGVPGGVALDGGDVFAGDAVDSLVRASANPVLRATERHGVDGGTAAAWH